jgi:hypothetical protein
MKEFVYNKRSDKDVEERIITHMGFSESVTIPDIVKFSPKVGLNKLRILPPTWSGYKHYGLDVFIHYNVGQRFQFLCPAFMKQKPCPVCEELQQTQDKKLKSEIQVNRRVAVWVIDRTEEQAGPKLFLMAQTIDTELLLQARGEDIGETLWIDDPKNGYDILFTKVGEKKNTKYEGIKISRNTSPLSLDPKQYDAWIQYIQEHPLPSIFLVKDYNYIKSVFYGTHPIQDEEEILIPEKNLKEEIKRNDSGSIQEPIVENTSNAERNIIDNTANATPIIDYNFLVSCTDEKLKNVALDIGVKERYVNMFGRGDLITEICEKMNITVDERQKAIEDVKAKLKEG